MKDPISSLNKNPEGLARQILGRFERASAETDDALPIAVDLIRALADSIKMMQPATFLNAIALLQEEYPTDGKPSLVEEIVSMLEETVMEWDMISRQTRFLWSIFHDARSQFITPGQDNAGAQEPHGPELFLADVADRMPQVMFELDENEDFVFINKQAFGLFGYDESDFPDISNCFLLVAPEDHQRLMDNLERTAQGYQSSGDEYTGIKKDGARFPIMIYASSVMHDDLLKGYCGFIIDMTHRKQAEEELMEAHAAALEQAFKEGGRQLRQIVDLVPHFICAKDSDGRFIFANKAVADAYGVDVDDLIGQMDPRSFSSDHQRSALQDDLEVIRKGTRKYIPEETVTDAQGNIRHLQTIKIPFTFSEMEEPSLLGVSVDITQRNTALNALSKIEERLGKYFEIPLIGVAAIDPSGKWLEVNDTLCEMTGYSRDDLLSMTWQDMTPEEDLPREMEEYLAFLEDSSASATTRETRFFRSDGTVMDVVVASHCTRKDDGTPDYVLCAIQDISLQKAAEQKAAESERELITILSASPMGITRVRDGMIEWVNESLCIMSGYTSEELTGRDASHLSISQEEYERVGGQLCREGRAETKWVTRDGRNIDIVLQGSPADGAAFILAATDITRLKREENILELTRLSVDSALDTIYWIDAGGRLAYVNDSACRSTGYTRDELLSMTVEDLDQNYTAGMWQQVWEKLVRTGSGRFESMHRRRDDSLFPVEINVSYLSYGEFAYACAFARDITEQKKAEQALHENVERWQSVESQNMEAVQTLAGDVAHYFNNLLSAIMGYASLLQMKMDRHGPLHSYAAHILTSSEKAVNLTQSMLAFSRKQARGLKPAALNDTVKKLQELLEGLIPKDNEVRVQTNENAPLFAMQTEEHRDTSRIIGGIETILIAGENKDVRQLLTRVLREHGYSVFTAIDGSAAIDMFRQHSGDIPLVILDIDMPKMNGIEAYEAIRRIDPSTKIIFTAEHGYDMVNNKGNEQYDILIKPLNPTALLKKIREVLVRKP